MYASFFDRMKAFLIDYIFILIYLGLLAIVAIFFISSLQEYFTTTPSAQLMGFFLVTFPVSLYFLICETFFNGQTVGKSQIGILVLTVDGMYVSFIRSLVRTGFKFLPWELSHYFIYKARTTDEDLFLYLMLIAISLLVITYIAIFLMSKKKQCLYDLVAGTVVEKVPSVGKSKRWFR